MKGLVALVLSVAIVDSLNPSTVGPAVYLATLRHAARGLVGFILGVFVVNLAAGIVLVLGPGQAVLAAVPHPGENTKHLIEIILGVAALGLAIALWPMRRRIARHVTPQQGLSHSSSLALGAGIALADLPTAFPYFGVLAAIIGSRSDLPIQVGLVVLFNVVFVGPLLVILAFSVFPGRYSAIVLESLRTWLDRWSPTLIPLVVLIFAVALLVLGGVGLATA
jgi:cytochrome c biogenesis protein CcdA